MLTTRVPNVSGTTTCDSSIESVPGRMRANSQLAASPIRSDSPVSATRPVIPSPTLQARWPCWPGRSCWSLCTVRARRSLGAGVAFRPGRSLRSLGSLRACGPLLIPADGCGALRTVRAHVLKHERVRAVQRLVGIAAVNDPGPVHRASSGRIGGSTARQQGDRRSGGDQDSARSWLSHSGAPRFERYHRSSQP